MRAADGAEARNEVRLRFRAWRARGTPPRKYALLVAHFYARSQVPSVRALARWVAESAERTLSHEEREAALRAAGECDRRAEWVERQGSIMQPPSQWHAPSDLRAALTDPERARGSWPASGRVRASGRTAARWGGTSRRLCWG